MATRNQNAESCAARLRLAMELHEAGVELARQRFKREAPDATPAVIREKLNAWLCEPPVVEPPFRVVSTPLRSEA